MFEEVHKGSGEHFALHPGEFVLGSTLEHITFPDVLAGQLMGKSSLGRLGLVIHQTAGFFDSGFAGNPTLELTNAAPIPIKLYPGMWVAQMGFILVDGKVTRPYGDRPSSKYHNQGVAPETSRMHENFGEQDGR